MTADRRTPGATHPDGTQLGATQRGAAHAGIIRPGAAPPNAATGANVDATTACDRPDASDGLATPLQDRAAPLLAVEHLRKHYPFTKGVLRRRHLGDVKAVDGISFTIAVGEALRLVGESGCGQTPTSRLILGLEQPTGGRLLLNGAPIHDLRGEALRADRAQGQAVFQVPWCSLNPRMTVGRSIAESLIVARWG